VKTYKKIAEDGGRKQRKLKTGDLRENEARV
jgi:hypothetical protein